MAIIQLSTARGHQGPPGPRGEQGLQGLPGVNTVCASFTSTDANARCNCSGAEVEHVVGVRGGSCHAVAQTGECREDGTNDDAYPHCCICKP